MKNLKNLGYIVLSGVLFTGCSGLKKENEKLITQLDSLNKQLEISMKATTALEQINVIMDSIDQARNYLKVDIEIGTVYEDFVTKMQGVSSYIKDAENRIASLEKELSTSKGDIKGYTRSIERLKNDLKTQIEEVASLKEKVDFLQKEKEQLVTLVSIQDTEIAENRQEITTKKQELALLESRIYELLIQSKVSESEAYYVRASAIEEAANRTKLAPGKKKETLREALKYYEKSFSLGKTEAQLKVDEIKKKIG